MAKAKDAFRTISEVAEWLDTPTHVLRFWESKFSQIKPVKGAGGRRYYRPTDMELLGGIKQLLHEDGLTIKGTQKLLREKGVKHVATLGRSAADTDSEPVIKTPIKSATPPRTPVNVAPQMPPPVQVTPPAQVRASEPVQDVLPFDPAPSKPAFQIDLPAPPTDVPELPGRLIGRAPLDPLSLRANAAQIAPLLRRLDMLRGRMRGQE